MESNSHIAHLRVFGNMSAESTLLFTDIFDLFPSSFSKLIPLLETRYRIIVYSDSGFDSFNRTRNLRHQTMKGYADDLIAALQERRLQNITYIAHSVNAMLAFHAAVKEPQLFEKIVLLSATPYVKYDLATQYSYGYNANTDDNLLFDSVMQTQTITEGNTEQLNILLNGSFNKMNIEKAKAIFHLLMTADSRTCLNKISIPVMILQGIGDKVATSETAYFMHRHIPDSFIVKIRAKGHLPQLNAPEEVFMAMEIFVYPTAC